MLEFLQVRNFQRHERLRIDFDPAVSTLIGRSDSGKSSVLRALRWLATNRPRGDSFVREGEDKTAVRLVVDGCEIVRRRTGTENTYKVDGDVLRSFGADVPERIERLLNVGDANWQGQHDPAFWFALTPGEVAKRLNGVVDLGAIDGSAARVASRLRRARAETEVVGDRLREAEAERDGTAFAEDLDAELSGLESAAEGIAAERVLESRLRDGWRKGMEYRRAVERGRDAVLDGGKVVSRGRRAVEAVERSDGLQGLVRRIGEAKRIAARPVPDLTELERLADGTSAAWEESDLLAALLEKIGRKSEYAADAVGRLEKAGARMAEETEGMCPICGGEWDGEA